MMPDVRVWLLNGEPISDTTLALLGYITPEQRAKESARLREAGKLTFRTHGRYSPFP